MNRREFLHPRRLANVAAPFVGFDAEPPPEREPLVLRYSRRAMATTFEVILPFSANAHQIAESALDEIDRLEAQLSVYRETSEVSRLNANAARAPIRVDAELFELLSLAQRIHRETDGAFDVAVGALIKAWGFYQRQGRVPSAQKLADVCQRVGMHFVELNAQRQTVFFHRQGIEINLGSIGKGYALDRAALKASTANIVLHGGHSSILAKGPDPVPIGIIDPDRPECRRAIVHLCNRGMATSAATHQHFVHAGRKLGHLLDPRTYSPAEGMRSATVTAPTAAEADALATAFFILGVDWARAYCDTHPDIGALLITEAIPRHIIVLGRAMNEMDVMRP